MQQLGSWTLSFHRENKGMVLADTSFRWLCGCLWHRCSDTLLLFAGRCSRFPSCTDVGGWSGCPHRIKKLNLFHLPLSARHSIGGPCDEPGCSSRDPPAIHCYRGLHLAVPIRQPYFFSVCGGQPPSCKTRLLRTDRWIRRTGSHCQSLPRCPMAVSGNQ